MQFIITIVSIICFSSSLYAQVKLDTAENKVEVIYSDLQRTILKGSLVERYLEGKVQIKKSDTYFYCDTAKITESYIRAHGDVSMIGKDSLELYADSLLYDLNNSYVYLYGSVFVKSGSKTLFSDYVEFDDSHNIAYYFNKAILNDATSELKSKAGIFYIDQNKAVFSESVSVIDTAFRLFTDSLWYFTDKNLTVFHGPTYVQFDTSQVYCESGFYDKNNNRGSFNGNASYLTNVDTAKADLIRFDGNASHVDLIGSAQYFSPDYKATGDSIFYSKNDATVKIIGNGIVEDDKQYLRSNHIDYNLNTKSIITIDKSTIQNNDFELNCGQIDTDENFTFAKDNVTFFDTINGVYMYSEVLEIDKSNDSYFKAYNPKGDINLKILMAQSDTIFLSSDTLLRQSVLDTTVSKNDSVTYMCAYKNVKMYSNDFQAVCDSLVFNITDSIITLYNAPFIWSDTSQFSGDTICMHIKNSEVHEIELLSNAFISNTTDLKFFNQIKGEHAHAYLNNGKIDSMHVDGSAEMLYYLTDKSNNYIGANTTKCSIMNFYFKDELKDIRFFQEPTSFMHPMRSTQNGALNLEGFIWNEKDRPQSSESILNSYFIMDELEN